MTPFRRGSVVLVPFPFTDLSAAKRRPALVVSSDDYNAVTEDVIIAQITSKLNSPRRPGDYRLNLYGEAGLPLPSLVRARMATLHGTLIVKQLGTMPTAEMKAISRQLASALGLP